MFSAIDRYYRVRGVIYCESSITGPYICSQRLSISVASSSPSSLADASVEFVFTSSEKIGVTSSRRISCRATLSPMSLNKRDGALLSLAVIAMNLLSDLSSTGISSSELSPSASSLSVASVSVEDSPVYAGVIRIVMLYVTSSAIVFSGIFCIEPLAF